MNRYILTIEGKEGNTFHIHEDEAETEVEFLSEVKDSILRNEEWTVHEVMRSTHKSDYVHSGHIDELVDDGVDSEE